MGTHYSPGNHQAAEHQILGLMMATYASADGSRVRPGQARLAAVMGTSISTVERGQRTMEQEGFLEMVAKGHSSGRGRSSGYASEYRLTIPSDLLDRVAMLDPDEKHPSSTPGESGNDPAPMTGEYPPEPSRHSRGSKESPVKQDETPVTGAEIPVNLAESPVTHDGPPQHKHHHKDQNKKDQSGFLTLSDASAKSPDTSAGIEAERNRQLTALQSLIDSQKEAS
ncbi:hypothetical protein GU243_06095 [Pseudarthrobacter psychrotolerans]|uniref:Helix-turn-helix domain-containing protein n=1 Tax=Pseudarthrobacter psychrotolerans TaxID=2697569 RepID=A0A6P1NK16_9MICC|nr:hypothetical protein [Pseudarthrobacter psychrotolerans]QHK19383.1 hypothetical protein GU243_06095 [Pseudarthrobacter psychrotolerans]